MFDRIRTLFTVVFASAALFAVPASLAACEDDKHPIEEAGEAVEEAGSELEASFDEAGAEVEATIK